MDIVAQAIQATITMAMATLGDESVVMAIAIDEQVVELAIKVSKIA